MSDRSAELWDTSNSDFLESALGAAKMFTPTINLCTNQYTEVLQYLTLTVDTGLSMSWGDFVLWCAQQFLGHQGEMGHINTLIRECWPDGSDSVVLNTVFTEVLDAFGVHTGGIENVVQATRELVDAVELMVGWVNGSHTPAEMAAEMTVPWWPWGAKSIADGIAAMTVAITTASIVNVASKLMALMDAVNSIDTGPMERSWSDQMPSNLGQLVAYNPKDANGTESFGLLGGSENSFGSGRSPQGTPPEGGTQPDGTTSDHTDPGTTPSRNPSGGSTGAEDSQRSDTSDPFDGSVTFGESAPWRPDQIAANDERLPTFGRDDVPAGGYVHQDRSRFDGNSVRESLPNESPTPPVNPNAPQNPVQTPPFNPSQQQPSNPRNIVDNIGDVVSDDSSDRQAKDQVKELQAAHDEQVQQLQATQKKQLQDLRDAFDKQLADTSVSADEQQKIDTTYEQQLQEQQAKYEQQLKDVREAQTKELEKLREAQDKQLGDLQREFDEQVADGSGPTEEQQAKYEQKVTDQRKELQKDFEQELARLGGGQFNGGNGQYQGGTGTDSGDRYQYQGETGGSGGGEGSGGSAGSQDQQVARQRAQELYDAQVTAAREKLNQELARLGDGPVGGGDGQYQAGSAGAGRGEYQAGAGYQAGSGGDGQYRSGSAGTGGVDGSGGSSGSHDQRGQQQEQQREVAQRREDLQQSYNERMAAVQRDFERQMKSLDEQVTDGGGQYRAGAGYQAGSGGGGEYQPGSGEYRSGSAGTGGVDGSAGSQDHRGQHQEVAQRREDLQRSYNEQMAAVQKDFERQMRSLDGQVTGGEGQYRAGSGGEGSGQYQGGSGGDGQYQGGSGGGQYLSGAGGLGGAGAGGDGSGGWTGSQDRSGQQQDHLGRMPDFSRFQLAELPDGSGIDGSFVDDRHPGQDGIDVSRLGDPTGNGGPDTGGGESHREQRLAGTPVPDGVTVDERSGELLGRDGRPLPTDPITGLQKLGDTYLDPLTGQELAADESGRVYDSLSGLHIDR
ncbi:MAG: hypothetical protein ACRCY8_05105, partial [Dermatophilaceae bacterium]